MDIFRLFLATILQRKVWVIWLVLIGVGAVVVPLMTPYEQDITLLEPQRAITVWTLFWIASLTWVLFQGSNLATSLKIHGLGDYFASQGVSPLRQLMQAWLAVMVFSIILGVATTSISVLWASPTDPLEAKLWLSLNLQFFALSQLTIGTLLFIAIGFSTRIGSAPSFLLALSVGLYGLYGVGYLKRFSLNESNALLDKLWTYSPHLHLSDLSHRLNYKLGALSTGDFTLFVCYLGGILLMSFAVSGVAFSPRLRNA